MTTATITARQLANRAAKREADAGRACNVIMTKALFGADRFCAAEDDFIVDTYGRKVRQSAPSDTEIAHALRGNRVIDSIDLNELLGPAAITKLISNGSLIRDAKHNPKSPCNLYWITTKARDIYGLPARITLTTGLIADYQPAA